MRKVDQLVFGYDDGHRLLEGSRRLAVGDVSLLLGATDAAPRSETDRLLTGLRLPASGIFAVCVTWSAPEISRPGAVWAHVLLIEDRPLGEMEDPLSLIDLARRPALDRISQYSESVPLDTESSPLVIDSRLRRPPPAFLERAIDAVYGASPSNVVV
jgi:hypothetical protein